MVFVPYDQFTNIEFIAEGGFSKIYKATWIDGPIYTGWNSKKLHFDSNYTVVLKKLHNSKNITSKGLHKLKIFYNYYTKRNTQCKLASRKGQITILSIEWKYLFGRYTNAVIGDLGISKSATESADDDNEKYGIIPYMAPEFFKDKNILKLQIYIKTFWDRNHDDIDLDIYVGQRPPIVTITSEGYTELMNECWHSEPEKRPTAIDIYGKLITCAIYKSRPLNSMIRSTMLRSQSINLEEVKESLKITMIMVKVLKEKN
ncbi:kinase-like domain-containing protein [Rhizophagus diaphanus]|nr:kinase-like domain-containing protein [Rhizophagus diaphanus] [Rhizophagus sp. MUCL 43196]